MHSFFHGYKRSYGQFSKKNNTWSCIAKKLILSLFFSIKHKSMAPPQPAWEILPTTIF